MRFSPEFLEEIRARLPVSEVVGRRVKLRKAGREWRGLSPFNAEKSPSFFVNDSKMAWFDFSSGRNGNVFDFVMATEGLSFPEAVERLATEAGLPMPRRDADDARRSEQRAGMVEACEWAAAFFEKSLAAPEGARARAYLVERAIAPEMRTLFRLGYAPKDRYALRDHLAGRGVAAEVMAEAGLLVHGEDVPVPFDRFRDRLMFPIADRSGRIVAFGGRALDKDVPAKYLNSPETPLFHKGGLLFNHHRARRPSADRGTVVVVEGYVDVIAMTAAGHGNVVAPLGTALTPDHCALLWRMADEPILCFDGDGAGQRAAFKAVETALPLLEAGRSLRFAFLPDGQDPDDLVRASGPGAVAAVLDAARPLSDVLWQRESEREPLDTPERRAGLEKRLRVLLGEIRDESVRRHYGTEMAARLRDRLTPARAPDKGGNSPPFRRPQGRFARVEPARGFVGSPLPTPGTSLRRSLPQTADALPPREVFIAAAILKHPRLLDWHAEDLAHLDFASTAVAQLRDGLLASIGEHPHEEAELAEALDRMGFGEIRQRIATAAARLPHWCLKPEASETDADQELRQAVTLHHKATVLHKALRTAQAELGNDFSEQRLAALEDARTRLSAFEGTEASIEGFGALSGRTLGL